MNIKKTVAIAALGFGTSVGVYVGLETLAPSGHNRTAQDSMQIYDQQETRSDFGDTPEQRMLLASMVGTFAVLCTAAHGQRQILRAQIKAEQANRL